MAHGFRDFNPWSLGTIVSVPIVRHGSKSMVEQSKKREKGELGSQHSFKGTPSVTSLSSSRPILLKVALSPNSITG